MSEIVSCNTVYQEVEAYMSYCPFEVHTDASTQKYLTTMKNQSGLFTRWYQELARFNFTVIHKKGKEYSNVDALNTWGSLRHWKKTSRLSSMR